MRASSVIAAMAAIFVLAAAVPALAQGHPFKVGEPFPDRALPAIDDGRPLAIADFRGKKVILHVFASW